MKIVSISSSSDSSTSHGTCSRLTSLSSNSIGSECEETGTTGPDSPPSKKVKRHVDRKYQSEWLYKYRMRHSDRGETYAYCTVCNVDYSVAGGGVF